MDERGIQSLHGISFLRLLESRIHVPSTLSKMYYYAPFIHTTCKLFSEICVHCPITGSCVKFSQFTATRCPISILEMSSTVVTDVAPHFFDPVHIIINKINDRKSIVVMIVGMVHNAHRFHQ